MFSNAMRTKKWPSNPCSNDSCRLSQAGLAQRERREEEHAEDALPDTLEPFDEEESESTLSGSLPEQSPYVTDQTRMEPETNEDVSDASGMPEDIQDDKSNGNDTGWNDVLKSAYVGSRTVHTAERQARVHQRQAAKGQARRARLGLPTDRPPHSAEDLGVGAPPRHLPQPDVSSPSIPYIQLPRPAVGVTTPFTPRVEPSPTTQEQTNKQEGITSRQATELVALFRKIEQNTEEYKMATEGTREAVGELADKIRTLGTMTQ